MLDSKSRAIVYTMYVNIIISVLLIVIMAVILDRLNLVTDLYRASIDLTCEGFGESLRSKKP